MFNFCQIFCPALLTNDPIFQIYSLWPIHWHISFLHFKTFKIQLPDFSPLHHVLVCKYTFTCQRWHFQVCQHRYPFSTRNFLTFDTVEQPEFERGRGPNQKKGHNLYLIIINNNKHFSGILFDKHLSDNLYVNVWYSLQMQQIQIAFFLITHFPSIWCF